MGDLNSLRALPYPMMITNPSRILVRFAAIQVALKLIRVSCLKLTFPLSDRDPTLYLPISQDPFLPSDLFPVRTKLPVGFIVATFTLGDISCPLRFLGYSRISFHPWFIPGSTLILINSDLFAIPLPIEPYPIWLGLRGRDRPIRVSCLMDPISLEDRYSTVTELWSVFRTEGRLPLRHDLHSP